LANCTNEGHAEFFLFLAGLRLKIYFTNNFMDDFAQ